MQVNRECRLYNGFEEESHFDSNVQGKGPVEKSMWAEPGICEIHQENVAFSVGDEADKIGWGRWLQPLVWHQSKTHRGMSSMIYKLRTNHGKAGDSNKANTNSFNSMFNTVSQTLL